MTMAAKTVYGVTGESPSNQIGIFTKRGGIINTASTNNLDVSLENQYFKLLHVGSGGDLVYMTPENVPDCYIGLRDGSLVPAVGSSVLTSAVIDGEEISTTCDDITWHGGE